MPRNNRSVDKSLKRTVLLDAAEVAFVDSGYDAVSVAEVARRCGVTATTVYWYFPSKDDLLAGIVSRWLDATVDEVSAAVAGRGVEAAARAVAAVLRELAPLLGALHERAVRSPAVAEVHESTHERLALLLAGEGADGTAATVFVLVVEGILVHPWGEGLEGHLLEAAVRAMAAGSLLAAGGQASARSSATRGRRLSSRSTGLADDRRSGAVGSSTVQGESQLSTMSSPTASTTTVSPSA